MSAPEPEYLVVGSVRKPHGIRGELAVQVDTDRPGAVFRPGRVLLVGTAAGQPDGRTLTVERARPFKEGLLVKVREHAGRDPGLEELRGAVLLIPRDEAAPLDDDEVFYHAVVGMRVDTAAGDTVGTVSDLYETPGGGILLGVRRERGKEILIPFVREMVRRLDRDARVVEIEAPPGLLEL